jgi:hypothetical protein
MTGKQTTIVVSVLLGLSLIVYFTDFSKGEKERINRYKIEKEQKKITEDKKKETQLKLKEIEKVQAEQNKIKGFHCLSAWDGSYRPLVETIKKYLKDPDSFKHRETTISPNNGGIHVALMTYGAKNSYGGYVVEKAAARLDSNCNLLEVMDQDLKKLK